MAAVRFNSGRNGFAKGEIHWRTSNPDTFRCCLMLSTYVPSQAGQSYYDDVATWVIGNGGSNVRTSCPELTVADPIDGACDAADVTVNTIPSTAGVCSYVLIFKDTGVGTTSPLIVCLDSSCVTNLPYTPTGISKTIRFDNGTNRIFRL